MKLLMTGNFRHVPQSFVGAATRVTNPTPGCPHVGEVTEPEVRSPSVSSIEGSDEQSLREFAVALPD